MILVVSIETLIKYSIFAHVGVFPFSIIILFIFLKYCLCIAGQGCQYFESTVNNTNRGS